MLSNLHTQSTDAGSFSTVRSVPDVRHAEMMVTQSLIHNIPTPVINKSDKMMHYQKATVTWDLP